jgi:hypothetical protein
VRETLDNPEILENAPHPTIFHNLINVEPGQRPPTFVSLRDEALLMVFAGTDTSSTTLTVGTTHILDYPEAYRMLNEELLQAWPELSNCPTFEVLDGLPYLVSVPSSLDIVAPYKESESGHQRISSSELWCMVPHDTYCPSRRRSNWWLFYTRNGELLVVFILQNRSRTGIQTDRSRHQQPLCAF